jgi:hypothetical protein
MRTFDQFHIDTCIIGFGELYQKPGALKFHLCQGTEVLYIASATSLIGKNDITVSNLDTTACKGPLRKVKGLSLEST